METIHDTIEYLLQQDDVTEITIKKDEHFEKVEVWTQDGKYIGRWLIN